MWASISVALPSSASAQVLTHKDVSARMAWKMIEASTAHCEKGGWSVTVAVSIALAGCEPICKATRRASPTSSWRGGRPTPPSRSGARALEWAQRTAPGSELFGQRSLTDVIPLGGGIPIKIGEDTIGGIGVSGAPGQEKDEACAKAGLEKVADQLK